ncbi:uncharacterized protein BCR38DRAFT_479277 [Pseudomassariella vexata]|uniref:Meiotic recombination protein DMC1 n=1 Tax=Pseudomassariella vexata TaxID=1141098 RepID=A0A1Y2D731_9PEZI|nr:uncharacterized protein BCR38DRAFT_479277 [Pseudomassariella vexata]ORY54964.1 hypothetical protein BCR38DRAFT_479277 [Pseudomassariella vexata]
MATATPSNFSTSGGFIRPHNTTALPSPAPSTASARAAAGLPRPRSKPLVPGSRKEEYARQYVSQRMLHISRRFHKKLGGAFADPDDPTAGYVAFDDICDDLSGVVDVLWFSGTPNIQIPFLLDVALAITEYLPAFPPAPRPTFTLLKKLDHCFASLLSGKDIRTHQPLTGLEPALLSRRGMTRTDMVRCKSLADETRLQVANKMSGEADVDTYLSDDDDFELGGKRQGIRHDGHLAEKTEIAEETDEGTSTADDTESRDSADSSAWTVKSEDNNDSDYLPPASTRRKGKSSGDNYVPTAPRTRKRKAGDENGETQTASLSPKRQKTVSPPIKMENLTPVIFSTAPPAAEGNRASNGGQFQWSVDEDSDLDDEDDEIARQASSPAISLGNAGTQQRQGTPQSRASAVDEVESEREEELPSDEDDEFHMNVAKVYEKTIVEIGNRLGQTSLESLVDYI